MKDYCTNFPDWIKFPKLLCCQSGEAYYIGGCCKKHDIGYDMNVNRLVVFAVLGFLLAYLVNQTDIMWYILLLPMLSKIVFDIKLFICVSKKTWWMFTVALLMFFGVSAFGMYYWIKAKVKR